MKTLITLSVVSLLALGCAAQASNYQPSPGQQFIRLFDSHVEVTKDGDLDVNETITMDFGSQSRHGILRSIPIEFQTAKGTYKTPLRLASITADGEPSKYSHSKLFNELTIKIGDPSRVVSGIHVYKLHYTVSRAVNFFKGEPEIYWNATGNESPFPIQRAIAEFVVPPGIDPAKLKAECYVGPQGSRAPGKVTIHGQNELQFVASDLKPYEGLTFALRLPPGSVNVNSSSEFMWWLMDWWPAIFTPWLVLMLCLTNWWVNGRDPANAYTAGVDWQPPKALSPAECGTLIDERCDVADIVSTLVDLAARGYLKITEVKDPVHFMFSNKNYQFTKTEPPAGAPPLKPYEKVFLDGIFIGVSPIVRLSDLKYSFCDYIPMITNSIYSGLTDKGYFVTNPDTCRSMYISIGVVTMVAAIVALVAGPAWALGLAISGVIILIGAQSMPARTPMGVEACRQIYGFKRFVDKAEKERIRRLAQEDPTIFGRLLPYAMVLGAADRWADAFRDLMTQPPDWYEPYDWNSPSFVFRADDFVNDLGDGMRTCATTLTAVPAPPSSSDSGAGGGFSAFGGGGGGGGGGFSGGGFGGGGVGSW